MVRNAKERVMKSQQKRKKKKKTKITFSSPSLKKHYTLLKKESQVFISITQTVSLSLRTLVHLQSNIKKK